MPIAVGVWTALACTYDGVGINLWMNGRNNGGRSYNQSLDKRATTGMFIGEDAPNGGDMFNGLIDNLRIWRRALSKTKKPPVVDGNIR